jgi:hypothetical protein
VRGDGRLGDEVEGGLLPCRCRGGELRHGGAAGSRGAEDGRAGEGCGAEGWEVGECPVVVGCG